MLAGMTDLHVRPLRRDVDDQVLPADLDAMVELFAAFESARLGYVETTRAEVLAAIARDLQAATVTQGTDVSTFTQIVADELGRTTSFMRLLEVYLGFGLLIGIAGLGVVMVRAARERRHEIGTLRAMGLQGRVVSRAFLIEAFFIAGGGVIIGTSLALVTAYQVVVNSSAFSIAAGSFVVPWVPLVLIAIVPTAFALLAAGQPARAVGRIRPAVALRIAD